MLINTLKLLSPLILLLLTGCSSIKVADSKFQPIFNFSAIKSYSLFDRNEEFSEWQALSDANRNSIELAIEQEMEVSGMDFIPAEQADIVITYFFVSGKRNILQRYNDKVKYCSYCLTNSASGKKKDKLNVPPGSLIIDAVKPGSKRSIWRSSYPLNIGGKDNSQQMNEKIKTAVNAMLSQLHKKLAG